MASCTKGSDARSAPAQSGSERWEGVWQLDQFPFRENCVEAANMAIDFLKHVDKALDSLDFDALQAAQDRQDAMATQRIARKALFGID